MKKNCSQRGIAVPAAGEPLETAGSTGSGGYGKRRRIDSATLGQGTIESLDRASRTDRQGYSRTADARRRAGSG